MFVYDRWWKIIWIIDWWPWEKNGFDFEIYWFYVDPNSQREWVWRTLWEYLMNSEYFMDKNSFYLWTLKENIVWWSFYKKMWWEIIEETKKMIGDKECDLVCYARTR
jgi:GNAT superfamily N-acetyltransferase